MCVCVLIEEGQNERRRRAGNKKAWNTILLRACARRMCAAARARQNSGQLINNSKARRW